MSDLCKARGEVSGAYYNEINQFKAQWLRNLIAAGQIAAGDVDERDVRDVRPDDLRGYAQCHFFAGIGLWSHALRLAGWADDRSVWTCSCPCQPFSEAGEGLGFADERHLWPDFFHLLSQRKPPILLGEQVASKDGLTWLDLVRSDLEGAGYACGPVDLCAAGVGAPHIRQRLFFVSHPARSQKRGAIARNGSGKTEIRWQDIPPQIGGPTGLHGIAHWSAEPDICRVVDGSPGVVEQISAYGDGIVPQAAAQFILAADEAMRTAA